jgi:hypothetical protein
MSLRGKAGGALGEDHRVRGGKIGGKSIKGHGHKARESQFASVFKDKPSANRSRSPGFLRIAPIDPGKQITKLRGRNRDRAVCRARPQKPAPFQTLREQTCALAVMPDHLQKIAAASAKAKQMPAQRIAP